MIQCIYTVYDRIGERYAPPFVSANDKTAMREFQAMPIPPSLRDDFTLVRIGTFDMKTGEIVPELIYSLSDLSFINQKQTSQEVVENG